jgi:hypothetical protein
MVVASFGVTGEQLSGIAATVPWVGLLLVVSLLFGAAARGSRWALPLLVVIAAYDQGYWGFQYVFGNPLRPLLTLQEFAALEPTPLDAQPGDLIEPAWADTVGNPPILRGLRVWPGYVGLPPALVVPAYDPNLVTERIAGVRWRTTDASGAEPISEPAARARLLSRVKVSSNVAADVRLIDIGTEALVDEPLDGLAGPPGSVRILVDRPGRIVVETQAAGPQLLALTERFHSGWRITDERLEDGVNPARPSSARPLHVYGDFLGCVVDAGTHRLTFRFMPDSFKHGLWITVMGLAIVLFASPFAISKRLTTVGTV